MVYSYVTGFGFDIDVPQEALDKGIQVERDDVIEQSADMFVDYLKTRFKDFKLQDRDWSGAGDEVTIVFDSSEFVDPNEMKDRIFGDSDSYQFIVSRDYEYGEGKDFDYYEEPEYDEMQVDIDVIFQDIGEYSVAPINEDLLDTPSYVETSRLNKSMKVKKDAGNVEQGIEMFNAAMGEELKEAAETLDNFLANAEVILVDDAETFDINEWEKENAEEMSEELNQKLEEAKADSRFIKYKLEGADVDKVIEKIKNSSINIVDYWKTNQFLKKRGLEKSDLDDVIHNLSKEDYKTDSKSIDNEHNEAIVFVKESEVKDLGPFNLYIKLDYDKVEENPVIVISIHETFKDQENKMKLENQLGEDTVKQGNKWVNKGKEGTHGKFATKKEADAQRKAMFAQGYAEELDEGMDARTFSLVTKIGKECGVETVEDLEALLKDYPGDTPLSAVLKHSDEYNSLTDSLNEESQEDVQFDKAIDVMKAYWNYDISIEQLHKSLLQIYNNDAEKAFKVFATYGDAARRNKNECLKEDIDDGEWEEVDSKVVEDSDGFMTDYVWYTDGFKHVFIFGDSGIYRPEDGDFDWEIDIVEGKEAEAYKEAQEWFDSYTGFAEENLTEANYGGAFDIRPDQYFTRDDVNDAAERVIDELNRKVSFEGEEIADFEVAESWFEDGKLIVRVRDKSDESEYEKSIPVDMRTIKKPSDLADKYSPKLTELLFGEIRLSEDVNVPQIDFDAVSKGDLSSLEKALNSISKGAYVESLRNKVEQRVFDKADNPDIINRINRKFNDKMHSLDSDLSEDLDPEVLTRLDEIYMEMQDNGGKDAYIEVLKKEIEDDEKFLSHLKSIKNPTGTNFVSLDDVNQTIEETQDRINECNKRLKIVMNVPEDAPIEREEIKIEEDDFIPDDEW